MDSNSPICYKFSMKSGAVFKICWVACLLILFSGVASASEKRIYNLSPAELDRVLSKLKSSGSDKTGRLKILAHMYKGASPYCADPLTCEKQDWFPYKKTNCTLLVLYLTAFLNSSSLKEARQHMRFLHYRDGQVDFKNRYHFTADRITDPGNPYFSACTADYVKDRSKLKQVSLVLNRTADNRPFFKGRLDGWKKALVLDYLPREGFSPELLKPLPDAVGVAFIKRSNWDKGIMVGHEGLLIDGDLFHSSPSEGVQVIKNYLSSAFPISGWEGLAFFHIHEVLPSKEEGKDAGKRGCSMVSPLKQQTLDIFR